MCFNKSLEVRIMAVKKAAFKPAAYVGHATTQSPQVRIALSDLN